MEKNVEEELQVCLSIVSNWRDGYEQYFDEHFDGDVGGWDFLITDLLDDIDSFLQPYLTKFQCLGYVSGTEMLDFIRQCFEQVTKLKEHIKDREDLIHQLTYSYGEIE